MGRRLTLPASHVRSRTDEVNARGHGRPGLRGVSN